MNEKSTENKQFSTKVKGWFFNNLGLKFLSVLVAFLIWLMVANGQDPVITQRFVNVPITIKNADVFMEKVNQVYKPREDTETVTVYVKATRSVIDQLSSSSFTVTADFENIIEGLNAIPLDIVCNTVPTLTMRDMWCDIRSLKVELEDVKESTFVVTVREDGTPASGYQVGNVSLDTGDSIAIAGPVSDINKIGKVVASVNVGDLSENTTVPATITIYDKNEEPFTDSQMERLTIKTVDGEVFEENEMDANVTIWRIKSGIVPEIELSGEPEKGYRVARVTTTPQTISLAGSEATLEEIGNHLEISGLISVDGVTETFTKEINLKEYLEDNYKGRLEQETDLSDVIAVTVQIEKIGTTTVSMPVSAIEILGRPENMSFNLTPADVISLEIQPDSEDRETITAEDIQVTLDLSDEMYQTPGNYKVELQVTLPEGYELASTPTIAVNLSLDEEESESETAAEGQAQ